jgi:hypothetical protein
MNPRQVEVSMAHRCESLTSFRLKAPEILSGATKVTSLLKLSVKSEEPGLHPEFHKRRAALPPDVRKGSAFR